MKNNQPLYVCVFFTWWLLGTMQMLTSSCLYSTGIKEFLTEFRILVIFGLYKPVKPFTFENTKIKRITVWNYFVMLISWKLLKISIFPSKTEQQQTNKTSTVLRMINHVWYLRKLIRLRMNSHLYIITFIQKNLKVFYKLWTQSFHLFLGGKSTRGGQIPAPNVH